jgi:hypothetical protein
VPGVAVGYPPGAAPGAPRSAIPHLMHTAAAASTCAPQLLQNLLPVPIPTPQPVQKAARSLSCAPQLRQNISNQGSPVHGLEFAWIERYATDIKVYTYSPSETTGIAKLRPPVLGFGEPAASGIGGWGSGRDSISTSILAPTTGAREFYGRSLTIRWYLKRNWIMIDLTLNIARYECNFVRRAGRKLPKAASSVCDAGTRPLKLCPLQ